MTSSAGPGGVGLVLVEFQYDYTGRDGATVSIRPNERYILLAKTNAHWWHVRKDPRAKPFYIPAKYVKELPEMLPSPLDFADTPGSETVLAQTAVPVPVPVPVPVAVPKATEEPVSAAASRPGDEVTIRLRSQQNRQQKKDNRMSTFGVPLEFNDPPPTYSSSPSKRPEPPALSPPGEGGLAKRRPSLGKALDPHPPHPQHPPPPQPRVPSFSPADPVHRPSTMPIPVETPSVPEPRNEKEPGPRSGSKAEPPSGGGGGGGGGGGKDKGLDAPLEPEKVAEEEVAEEEVAEEQKGVVSAEGEVRDDSGDNIYETIMDLNLDLSSIMEAAAAASNAIGASTGGQGGQEAPAFDPATLPTPPTQVKTPPQSPHRQKHLHTPHTGKNTPTPPNHTQPRHTPTQNAISPNTAVYANVNDLKKNLPQPPTVSVSSPTSPAPASPTSPAPSSGPSSSGPASPLSPREGWQVHTDKDSGKEFYYNPTSGQTTWSNPRSPPPSSWDIMDQSKGKGEGLLSPSPGHSPAASSKGSGWEPLVDDTTGRKYYYNPTSGDTSWDAPEPSSPSSPRSGSEEDYPLTDPQPPRGPPPTLPKRAVIPRATLEGGIPSGWSRCTNAEGKAVLTSERTQEQWIKSEDERGKTYYYQKDGSKSQWALPELPGPTPSLPRLGNDLDLEAPSVPHSWRQTMGPAQFGPATEDNRFFLSHRRNCSDYSEASSSGNSPETPHHLEKAGILNKTKIADNGKRIRKNWGQSWTVLHGGILTFHRDPKSAPASNSNKSNQIVPEYTVELKGAALAWAPKDKSSKKNVLELKTRQGCEYLIQYDTESIIYDWHKVLYETIRQLEKEHLSEEEEEEVLVVEKSPNPPDREDKEKRRTSSRVPSVSTPESEQGRVRTKLRKFLQRRPTLQSVKEKGYIRDSVFGCHLDTLCHRENSTIPKFLEKCIRAVERRGLDVDGIYRVSGNLAVIQKLRHKADHEEDLDLEDGQWEEIHVITGALKLFLRELPEPLFPYSFFDKFIAAIKVSDYPQKVSYFRDLVRSLPLPNHDTMEQLFKHLRKVIEYGEANRMSVQSVAIVFGPTLLRPLTESANITMHMVFQNQIVELILNEFHIVFPPS
ncbi:rho GTPase-activating protein 27 [Aplochiton taeniatus]